MNSIKIELNSKKCYLCGTCVAVCPKDAIIIMRDKWTFYPDRCVGCKFCVSVCPVGALTARVKNNEI